MQALTCFKTQISSVDYLLVPGVGVVEVDKKAQQVHAPLESCFHTLVDKRKSVDMQLVIYLAERAVDSHNLEI